MDTETKRVAILFIFIAVLLLTGCSRSETERASCDTSYPTRSGAGGSYDHQNRTEIFLYTVTREITTTRLHLIFEQTEGSVSWRFADPTGEVRWEGEYEGRQYDDFRDFEPIEGEWKLEIDGSQGSGKYDICWMAR